MKIPIKILAKTFKSHKVLSLQFLKVTKLLKNNFSDLVLVKEIKFQKDIFKIMGKSSVSH